MTRSTRSSSLQEFVHFGALLDIGDQRFGNRGVLAQRARMAVDERRARCARLRGRASE